MRTPFLLSCLLVAGTLNASAQSGGPSPSQPQTPPATARPAPAAPSQTRRAAATARSGMAITATYPDGQTLEGVTVDVTGPTDRNGTTDGSGHLNLPGLLAGTYRLRFSGEKVTTFEREVALRAGQVLDIDVALDRAPEPPPPPPPAPAPEAPAPARALVGPKGQPLTLGIVELLDREFVGREPRRESLLSCSGNERSTMIQLNEPMPQRLYENADAVYYVLAGEGAATLDGRNSRISTNGFISVPRGVPHSFERRGSRPLVLLAVLAGEPCERAK